MALGLSRIKLSGSRVLMIFNEYMNQPAKKPNAARARPIFTTSVVFFGSFLVGLELGEATLLRLRRSFSSRRNHALAKRSSRLIVGSETPRAAAVSAKLIPPKERISTMRHFRSSWWHSLVRA